MTLDKVGYPYVVTNYGQIFRFNGRLWEQLPGDANDIDIGADGSVWALNAYGQPEFITTDTTEKLNPEEIWEEGSGYRGF